MNILITGITGTLGTIVTQKLLEDGHVIIGLSRDEQKQQTFKYKDHVNLILGDVRDRDSFNRINYRIDKIFHFAALKCIDVMERNPLECIKTNLQATKNVLNYAEKGNKTVIFTSTDKAVYPVNVYGHCKAISETLILDSAVRHIVCRYGNVIGSRGSVIPLFYDSIKNHGSFNITSMQMTRFWITQDEAADFVIDSANKIDGGLKIPFIRSASVYHVAETIQRFLNKDNVKIKKVDIRPGEKLHECLSREAENGVKDAYSNNPTYLMNEKELEDLLFPILKGLS